MLFKDVFNVVLGPLEDSKMTTGVHTIRSVYCVTCLENLGWYYEVAVDEEQRYKEGHYILEDRLIEKVSPDETDD